MYFPVEFYLGRTLEIKICSKVTKRHGSNVLNKFKVSYKTTPPPPELLQYPKFI